MSKTDKAYEEGLALLLQVAECFAGRPAPEKELEKWKKVLQLKRIPKREMLLCVGDIPQEYYFLIQGLTRQYYLDQEGFDVTRGFSIKGEFLCTEALIEDDTSPYSVETLEDCLVFAFRVSEFEELSRTDYMKDLYIGALKANIKSRISRDIDFLTCGAAERYKSFVKKYPGYEKRIRQSYLASYLRMTPENLSRIKRAIKEGK